jgi:hypothetical protein
LSGDYQITVRDAARDKSKLAGFLAEAKKLKPDLVVTWGTSVSKRIIGRSLVMAAKNTSAIYPRRLWLSQTLLARELLLATKV